MKKDFKEGNGNKDYMQYLKHKISKNKIVVLLLFIIVLIIVSIVTISRNNDLKVDETDLDVIPESITEYIDATRGRIIKLENFADVVNVSACLNRFYSNYYAKDISDNNREKAYNMLSADYRDIYNISIEDINSNVEFNDLSVEIYNIYLVTDYNGISLYFVKGLVRDLNYDSKEFENIVVLDRNNNSFEVYLDNYLKDRNIEVNSLTLGEEYSLPEIVEKNEFNSYTQMGVTMNDYVARLFSSMRNSIIYNQNYIENMLYENSNINNVEELNDFYIKNKRNIILGAYADYKLDVDGNNNIITCFDKNNSFKIVFYMDAYSSFKFDLISIE